MQNWYSWTLLHACQNSAEVKELAQCTTQFLIKKTLHILETLLWSPKGEKYIHDVYEESGFSPWLPRSFQTKCLNYMRFFHLLSEFLHPTSLLSWALYALTPGSIKTNDHGEGTILTNFHFSHFRFVCSWEMGSLFGEQGQKKIPKVGLPLSFLPKGKKMELHRKENSTTERNVFAELWSLQGMTICKAEDLEGKD